MTRPSPLRKVKCPYCKGQRWQMVRVGWGLKLVVCVPCQGRGRVWVVEKQPEARL